MTKLTEDLLELQSILRQGGSATAEQKARIEILRAGIPTPVLSHFLRQIAAGRKGLAIVRGGVCGECHIRLSHALVHTLSRSDDLMLCENCGAFVVLSPEDKAALVASAAVAPKARRVTRRRETALA